MTHFLQSDLARPIVSILGAGGLWLGKNIAATIQPPPIEGWPMVLDRYGLPVALLLLAIYGGHGMFKLLQKSEAARLQDRKDMEDARLKVEAARLQDAKDHLAQYRLDTEAAQRSRMEMIREIQEQTRVIREKPTA